MAPAGSPARISRFTSLLVSARSLNILLCQRTMSPRFTRCSTGQSLSAGLWSVYRIWSSSEHRQSVCDVWFLLPYKAIHKIKTTSHKLVACVIFLSLSSSGRIWLYMCSVWFGSCWTGSCHGMQGCWCFQDHRRWHQPRQMWDRQDFWSNWVCEP